MSLVLGCTTTTNEVKRGELVLVLQTDLSVPKDVSSLRVEVLTSGRVQFAQTYLIGPAPQLEMPAALSIVAGENAADPVSIRILARQVNPGADLDQGVPRVLREIITTVPPDRTAMLPVTLHWLCADAKSLQVSGAGEISTSCGEGLTCVAGTCSPQEVDSASLPDFVPAALDGSAAAGSGCFDVLGCLAGAPVAAVDPVSCTIAAPGSDPSQWNVALRLPPNSSGSCDALGCFIPLDADAVNGWSPAGAGRLQLPSAVCASTPPVEVVAAAGCASKSALNPVCGPASRFDTPLAGGSPMPPDGTMMPPGMASVPETVLLSGIRFPRHVVVDPLGVFFIALADDGVSEGVYWCALAGCNSQAQALWLGPPGALTAGFAHNQSYLTVWGWDLETMQIHSCPFPGGCVTGTGVVLAAVSATPPPMPVSGMMAMTNTAVIFREAEPSARLQSCHMLDVGCGAMVKTQHTDHAPVRSLALSADQLVWANNAGELQHCEHDNCGLTVQVATTGQSFVQGPVVSSGLVVWASDRVVRACELLNCAATQRDLFTSASPVTGLATDGTNAYFGFVRNPSPPVHDLVSVPLDGSMLGTTLRSGDGFIDGLGVDAGYVYSFVVDAATGEAQLIRTSKQMMPPPLP